MRFFLGISLIVILSAGCSVFQKTPQQRHPASATDPGSTTSLDADAYDALIFAHDAIETTKTDLSGSTYSASQAVTVKQVLNGTITAYDLANSAYKTYHASQTPANAADLQAKLPAMKDATAKLAAAKKGSN